jgi:thiol-disulfide isomerase/thioredoxin
MKWIAVVLAIVQANAMAQPAKVNFQISGIATGSYKGKIFLRFNDKNNDYNVLTADLIDGRFLFKGFLEEPVRAGLGLEAPSNIAWVYLDTGKISLTIKTNISGTNEITLVSVGGSVSDNLFHVFDRRWHQIMQANLDDAEKGLRIFSAVDSFVNQYPDQILSSLFLNQSIGLLSYEQAKSIFDKLSPDQKQRASFSGLSGRIESLQKTQAGAAYPFIPQPDPSGKLITGKELRYDYLLVDFWASWCGPCRDENPALVSLYRKYRGRGFEILGVSLDKNKSNWVRAIQNDSLPWVHVSDLKEFDNEIAKYYSITAIPFNLLIDKQGRIVAKDLRGELLEKKLMALFHE